MSQIQPTLEYAPVPERFQNTPLDIARRAALWTILCSVSAAPSFFWAVHAFDELAMILGVVLFICLYTAFTSTPAFLRFREGPFVRRTLYIGYTTRVCLSLAFPVGMAADLFPGLVSIEIISTIGFDAHEFVGTFLITVLQGTILNIIISIYMAFIWALQRAFCKMPQDARGFPVESVQPLSLPQRPLPPEGQ